MTDAWEIFVRGISPARLESERFGRTKALNVAKRAVDRERFNTPGHAALLERHYFRGLAWRHSLERAEAAERLQSLEELRSGDTKPKRKRNPKPPPVIPSTTFTSRHLEIAMAAMDAPKAKPVHKYAA